MNSQRNNPNKTLRWLGWVAEHIATGKRLPHFLELYLFQRLKLVLDTNGAVSLDQAFGLRCQGGISPAKAVKNAERNDMLRHLRNEHPEWSQLVPSIASRRMRAAFERYEAVRWKREEFAAAAPSAEPFTTFWRIQKAGMKMPQEARLRQILEDEIQ